MNLPTADTLYISKTDTVRSYTHTVSQSVTTSQDSSMATALVDPSIERDNISESELLLGENDKKGHERIIKNANYKEMNSIKNKEETKGEKQKEKKTGEKESDKDDEDKEEEEPRSDPGTDSGADSGVNNCPPLSCHNSCQNTERINNIIRATKRHKTMELSIKTIFIGFVLMGTAILCFNYGKTKAKIEAREDKTLKSLDSADKPSILMERIFDQVSRDPEEDDTEDDTETTEDNKKPTEKQGNDGRDEVDEFHFTDQEPEDRDDGSMTTTTKKPFVVSFWPR